MPSSTLKRAGADAIGIPWELEGVETAKSLRQTPSDHADDGHDDDESSAPPVAEALLPPEPTANRPHSNPWFPGTSAGWISGMLGNEAAAGRLWRRAHVSWALQFVAIIVGTLSAQLQTKINSCDSQHEK